MKLSNLQQSVFSKSFQDSFAVAKEKTRRFLIVTGKVAVVGLIIFGLVYASHSLSMRAIALLERVNGDFTVPYAFMGPPLFGIATPLLYHGVKAIFQSSKYRIFRYTDDNWKDLTHFTKDILQSAAEGCGVGAAAGVAISFAMHLPFNQVSGYLETAGSAAAT